MSPAGYLTNPQVFAERGQYSVTVDHQGNVYVADGQIYVYDKAGKQLEVIKVPERPATIAFGGKEGKTLYITARTSLYSVQVK